MADSETRSDRRQFTRFPCGVPCKVLVEGRVYEGFLTNASARGVFVQTSTRLEEGAEVGIRFESDGEAVEAQGTVARRHRPHRSVVGMKRPGFGMEVKIASESFFKMLVDILQ